MVPTPDPWFVRGALLGCVFLARVVVWRRREYRGAANWLAALAAVDSALWMLGKVINAVPHGLFAFFFIGWYGIEAALAGIVLAQDKSHRHATGWGVVALLVGLAWAWLAPWGEAIYAGAFATSLVIQLGSLWMFTSRRPREVPTQEEVAVMILVASSAIDALGPWIAGQPRRDWHYGAWISLLTWVMICGLETIWILTRVRCSPPSDS